MDTLLQQTGGEGQVSENRQSEGIEKEKEQKERKKEKKRMKQTDMLSL